MCQICGQPYYVPCNCLTPSCSPCSSNTSCPILLDSACVIYHKNNNILSGLLDSLGINNGATLELILDTMASKIGQLNFTNTNLPFLDDTYVINSLQSFATAVDSQFSAVNDSIGDLTTSIADMGYIGAVSADPNINDVENGQYWWRTDLSANVALRIKLNGSFRTIPTTV